MGNTPSSRHRRGGNGDSRTRQDDLSTQQDARRHYNVEEHVREQNAATNRTGVIRRRLTKQRPALIQNNFDGDFDDSKGASLLSHGQINDVVLNPYLINGDRDPQLHQDRSPVLIPLTPRSPTSFAEDSESHQVFEEFTPEVSEQCAWMGRSVEKLLLGHISAAPILSLPDSTDNACVSCRTSDRCIDDGNNGIRGHSSSVQGEDISERLDSSALHPAIIRRTRSGGPNVVLSLLAREATGKATSNRQEHSVNRLKAIGGQTLYSALDKPSGAMLSETNLLKEAIENKDWVETQAVVSRLSPRLIGDPSVAIGGNRGQGIDDPSLPPGSSPYRGGGGRLGFEREVFVLSGGIELLVQIFREPSFVGDQIMYSNDARDLSKEIVSNKLSGCWNEVMASLRELTYALPDVIEASSLRGKGNFLPFLFTLLSHDSCFDGAATLIEEILSFQAQMPTPDNRDGEHSLEESLDYRRPAGCRPTSTFYLGNVPDLYSLWGSFSCRRLAHFCRILALLVFEPEDRQLLESPSVLKSIDMLQLRRDRAARAGQDAAVDMNQAILLGDPDLLKRLLQLMKVMNFSPDLKRGTVYHVMAHFPWIADTLAMLGLSEFVDWSEVEVVQDLARKGLDLHSKYVASNGSGESETVSLSELGSVASMLEDLEELFLDNSSQQATQVGHIIRVVNAAQSAGVVDGRQTPGRPEHSRLDQPMRGTGLDYAGNAAMETVGFGLAGGPSMHVLRRGRRRFRISTPQDAANAMQFNALLLAPYQVEVLFVLCTLLGGRRKIDTQRRLDQLGLIPILDDMFHRLSWGHTAGEPRQAAGDEEEETPNGIHGPGCECNPESALRVQYLRLLHNFCDRDCNNYSGRRLLLSAAEREFISSGNKAGLDRSQLRPGLLSKVLAAFMGETDDSPYRFWLASCAESFLRGSSHEEQVFVAHSGLLDYLKEDVVSDKLHCAGSLQTAFDLLGELCKGNREILHLLFGQFGEDGFTRIMRVAASNLVDSNVFLRSMILSVERIVEDDHIMNGSNGSCVDPSAVSFLTHSWWDPTPNELRRDDRRDSLDGIAQPLRSSVVRCKENYSDRPSVPHALQRFGGAAAIHGDGESIDGHRLLLDMPIGHFEWVFSPPVGHVVEAPAALGVGETVVSTQFFKRLAWFLLANQTRLVRDLLDAVNLQNINHENICCLNTAVIVAVFAYRRQQLPTLIQELRHIHLVEMGFDQGVLGRIVAGGQLVGHAEESALDMSSMRRSLQEVSEGQNDQSSRLHRSIISASHDTLPTPPSNKELCGGRDIIRNFRELLWFWSEYYTHRGRDRLSLEFSSQLRFQEWMNVVSLLSADDGSATSLLDRRMQLPRSPYRRSARVFDNRSRGF